MDSLVPYRTGVSAAKNHRYYNQSGSVRGDGEGDATAYFNLPGPSKKIPTECDRSQRNQDVDKVNEFTQSSNTRFK